MATGNMEWVRNSCADAGLWSCQAPLSPPSLGYWEFLLLMLWSLLASFCNFSLVQNPNVFSVPWKILTVISTLHTYGSSFLHEYFKSCLAFFHKTIEVGCNKACYSVDLCTIQGIHVPLNSIKDRRQEAPLTAHHHSEDKYSFASAFASVKREE